MMAKSYSLSTPLFVIISDVELITNTVISNEIGQVGGKRGIHPWKKHYFNFVNSL